MLIIEIQGDEFRMFKSIKKQMKLKRELLGRYKGTEKVTVSQMIKGKPFYIEEILLEDLFN